MPTYAHDSENVGNSFRWRTWVRNLVSQSSNCLPFMRNLRLQLSTPWLCSILRFCHSGKTYDKVWTIILTDIMISAAICHPLSTIHHTTHGTCPTMPTICHLPHTSWCLASAPQQVSGSSKMEHTWEPIVKWVWMCLPIWRNICERLGGVLAYILRGVLGSVLRAYLWVYCHAGWECAIRCNCKCTWEHTRECDWERLESILGSI